MPPHKPKPSEIAAEAKKNFIPYIRQHCPEWPATSVLCHSESIIAQPPMIPLHCRFAFYEENPVDLALKWVEPDATTKIPVIMPANEKRAGGDWEAGVMSPEECLCRRSNLYATLTTPVAGNAATSNYPIPSTAGIYSENVVVFRNGPEKYEPWTVYKALPIISVCPVKRPKLDSSGKKYSFKQEKELMGEKIRSALRIAVYWKHTQLCIGAFGLGSGFRNPTEEVAHMWRDALLKDPEFVGHFQDVLFAFEPSELTASGSSSGSSSKHTPSKSSSSKGSSTKSSSKTSSSSKASGNKDLDIFREVFKPSNIHGAFDPSKIGNYPTPPGSSYVPMSPQSSC